MRRTELQPTKSGIIGLICASMGKPREEPNDEYVSLSTFSGLRMTVRVDNEGRLVEDFHMTGSGSFNDREYGVISAGKNELSPVISRRHYLADAAFLVLVEGNGEENEDLLHRINDCLHRPVWPPFLGRKSCPPAAPIWMEQGVVHATASHLLKTVPLLAPGHGGKTRVVSECSPNDKNSKLVMDVPISFEPKKFGPRYVAESEIIVEA